MNYRKTGIRVGREELAELTELAHAVNVAVGEGGPEALATAEERRNQRLREVAAQYGLPIASGKYDLTKDGELVDVSE